MSDYEIMLFGDGDKAVNTAWRDTWHEAMDFAALELRAGRGGAYNAAVWNDCPAEFYVIYVNDKGEIFVMRDPCILTREKAGRLRKRAASLE